jgi:hypothetical protein
MSEAPRNEKTQKPKPVSQRCPLENAGQAINMWMTGPDLGDFLNTINCMEPAGFDKHLPTDVVRKMAHLTKVSNYELFRKGIIWAVFEAFGDALTFPKQVYREEFIRRLDKLKRRAALLAQEIDSLLHPWDPVTFMAQKYLSEVLDEMDARYRRCARDEDRGPTEYTFSEFKAIASILVHSIELTKYVFSRGFPERGRPVGAAGSGMARDKLIMRLEFATRVAGGKLTLNKNAEKGTLIDTLEILRDYLPRGLVPRSVHPYSSYQRVLTRARSEWNSTKSSAAAV